MSDIMIIRYIYIINVLFIFCVFSCESNSSSFILKADDYPRGNLSRWMDLFNVARNTGVNVHVGVIVSDLNSKYISILNEEILKGGIKIFYHGSDHNCKDKSTLRFYVGSIFEQIELLANSKAYLEKIFSADMSTFGAPCNKSNEYTGAALNSTGIKYWFLPYKKKCYNFKGRCFKKRINLEYKTGKPSYSFFLKNYLKASKNNAIGEAFIIQFHPGYWEYGIDEFSKTIKYLRGINVDSEMF